MLTILANNLSRILQLLQSLIESMLSKGISLPHPNALVAGADPTLLGREQIGVHRLANFENRGIGNPQLQNAVLPVLVAWYRAPDREHVQAFAIPDLADQDVLRLGFGPGNYARAYCTSACVSQIRERTVFSGKAEAASGFTHNSHIDRLNHIRSRSSVVISMTYEMQCFVRSTHAPILRLFKNRKAAQIGVGEEDSAQWFEPVRAFG
jgi:hypothetical protein